tara:strand:+ start:182 stop:442 length:261 start_codon:yes stop_codon:yes gene_type:complete
MILREELVAKRRRRKSVPKDKKSRVPKKYLSGTKGSKRAQLASVIKRIAALYKAGKTVPRSLIKQRIALGKSSGKKKRSTTKKSRR